MLCIDEARIRIVNGRKTFTKAIRTAHLLNSRKEIGRSIRWNVFSAVLIRPSLPRTVYQAYNRTR